MRNYAKYCKINLNNKKYQLNLTEGGQDDAHFINKFASGVSLLAPTYMVYKLIENFVLNNAMFIFAPDLISKLIASGIIFFTFCLPITNVGKGYNAILRSILLKRKTKRYYAKMRKLEANKNNINEKNFTNKQIKITNKFVKHLKKVTNFNDFISRKYQRRIDKKGFVDGTRAFANDNIESVQEAIDKFIFHNREWLYNFCPKYKNFIKERMRIHYSIIKNEGNYYDEYIWSASHKDDVIVKNDCILMFEDSNYLDNLRKLFNINNVDKKQINKPTPTHFKVEDKKIEQSKVLVKDIYKNQSNETIKTNDATK